MKTLLIVIGAIIIAYCGYKMITAPIDSDPFINQFYVYGFALGGVIEGCGICSGKTANTNSDTK